MTRLPTGAHELVGFEDYGVDQKGVGVFFGFQLRMSRPVLHCNYATRSVHYLFAECAGGISTQRPSGPARRGARKTNFVRQLDFEADVTGNCGAALRNTDGQHRLRIHESGGNCRRAFAFCLSK